MEIAKSYSNQPLHAQVGGIIRDHSENKTDIRSIAKSMIEWKDVRRVIDLGCGYGWFEDALKDTTNGSLDLIVGIDYLIENNAPFLELRRR